MSAIAAIFGASITSAESSDQDRQAVIEALLKMPAPPPDWRAYLEKRKSTPPSKPAADAPIKELTNYWRTEPENEIPDEVTRKRLLEACEAAPEELDGVLSRLALDSPEVQERLKKLHDRLVGQRRAEDRYRIEALHDALMTHSMYFRDELVRRLFFPDDVTEPAFQEATKAFLNLDREGARQLFLKESTSSNQRRRVIALSALRQHFVADSSSETTTTWLNDLKRIATDRKATREVRQFALSAVMISPTPEIERWFLDLFRDASLDTVEEHTDSSTPLGNVVATKPDYWIPKVVAMVGNKNAAVHANAVHALIYFCRERSRADALRPLLPWLENPKWAPDPKEIHGRSTLIAMLDRVDLPEAVPGLLKLVESATEYDFVSAAEALAKYNARAAVEPLKRGLKREKDENLRRRITRALVALGGLTTAEMTEALKLYAIQISSESGRKEEEAASELGSNTTLDPRVSLGKELARSDLSDDKLCSALLSEADRLAGTSREAAELLRQFVAQWQTPSALKSIVDRLRSGNVTANWLKQVIAHRKQLARPLSEVGDLEGIALGVQAAITGDSSSIDSVLGKRDRFAQLSLLACARLERVDLPVEPIAQWLRSDDKLLARTADSYLEANDSPVAREQLWKAAPEDARILGARWYFDPGHFTFGAFDKTEKELRDAIRREKGVEAIYALLSEGYWGGNGQRALFVERGKTILRADDGNGRTRECAIADEEIKSVTDWLQHESIEDLPPFDAGAFDGIQWEFVRLTRDGGRRIFMNNPPEGAGAPRVEIERQPGPDPAIYGELTRRLKNLTERPMQVVYRTLNELPGFQLVHALENGEVTGIKNGNDHLLAGVRLPSEDATAWHRVSASGLSKDFELKKREEKPADEPDDYNAVEVVEGPFRGKKLVPIGVNKKREEGLWALAKDGKAELIAKGNFSRPVVCPGGEWIVVAKTPPGQSWAPPNGVVRIHLPDKRVIPIDLPPAENFDPLAWIAAHQRVLLSRQRDDPRLLPPRDKPDPNAGPENPEYHLLDPITGKLERVDGDFRPLRRLEGHDLQPTNKPNEFWAVIIENGDDPDPTAVLGKYSTRQFRFTEALRFPKTWFHSWDCVIDHPNHCAWIAVNGDLLRVHLPETDQDSSPPKSK